MNHSYARRLLLVLSLAIIPAVALAQYRSGPQPQARDSHRLIEDGIPSGSLEEAMAQRLRQLREPGELQELARKLLNDPKTRDLIKSIPPEKLEKLKQKIDKGEGFGDENFKRLMDQMRTGQQAPPPDLADKLTRWADNPPAPVEPPPTVTPPPGGSPSPPGTSAGSQPPAMPSPPPPPPRSPWEEWKEKSTNWFKQRLENAPDRLANILDDVGDGSAGDAVRDAIRSLSRSPAADVTLPFGLSDGARGLAGNLGGLGERLPMPNVNWKSFSDLVRGVHAPSMPSFSGPDLPSGLAPAGGVGGGGLGTTWLWLVLFAVLAFVLWKSVGNRLSGGEEAVTEKVGPWPVAPAAVSTRRDLVLAFEYLALKCLGPAARAQNHLALAAELGEQAPAPDPDQRRQAAGELARLYEHARYTPDDEPLTAADLAAARRDLCLLAGVATA
jgi:hypothetical protein